MSENFLPKTPFPLLSSLPGPLYLLAKEGRSLKAEDHIYKTRWYINLVRLYVRNTAFMPPWVANGLTVKTFPLLFSRDQKE